jgi:hypothetical protein
VHQDPGKNVGLLGTRTADRDRPAGVDSRARVTLSLRFICRTCGRKTRFLFYAGTKTSAAPSRLVSPTAQVPKTAPGHARGPGRLRRDRRTPAGQGACPGRAPEIAGQRGGWRRRDPGARTTVERVPSRMVRMARPPYHSAGYARSEA